jgi:hypothetical protein
MPKKFFTPNISGTARCRHQELSDDLGGVPPSSGFLRHSERDFWAASSADHYRSVFARLLIANKLSDVPFTPTRRGASVRDVNGHLITRAWCAALSPRPTRRAERGGAKINLFLTLLVLAAMGIAAVKIVPPYVNNYQFQDAINTEARFALTGYPKKTPDDIRQEIYKKAEDLDIPAEPQDIHVDISNGNVSISLDYSIPVDLYVYQFALQFHPHADNHTI